MVHQVFNYPPCEVSGGQMYTRRLRRRGFHLELPNSSLRCAHFPDCLRNSSWIKR
jgi:hypothetical protein